MFYLSKDADLTATVKQPSLGSSSLLLLLPKNQYLDPVLKSCMSFGSDFILI